MSKHTSGKWTLRYDGDKIMILGPIKDDGWQTVLAYLDKRNTPQAEANAERIIDCVNACEGINPKAVPETLEILKKLCDRSIQDYENQRATAGMQKLVLTASEIIAEAEGK